MDIHGDAERIGVAGEDAFEAGEGSQVNADVVAGAKVGIGVDGAAGGEHEADMVEVGFGDFGGNPVEADEGVDGGEGEDLEAALVRETGENIAGEQGESDVLAAVRPTASGPVERQVVFDRAHGE